MIAALWGLGEATLFFFVPDIWLSLAGRKKLSSGLLACLFSLAGALIGGMLMYVWGQNDLHGVLGWVDTVPAISQNMIQRVNGELVDDGAWSILLGPLRGTPYKVYAAQAASAGLGLWLFLLISIPARLIRFALVTIVCHYALRWVGCSKKERLSFRLLIIGWIVFYVYYFYAMAAA